MENPDNKKLSKNQLKKLKKQQEKQAKAKKKGQGEGEKYYQERRQKVLEFKNSEKYFPYPHKFNTTHSVKEVVEEFDSKCTENEKFLDVEVSVAGRVDSIRKAGKALIFIDLQADATKIQILGKNDCYTSEEDFQEIKNVVKRGDIIGVNGKIGRSKTGELTILTSFI